MSAGRLLPRGIGARALALMSAYVLAGAIVLIVVLVLRRHISASALRDLLSYFFISSLAASLEPAT